MVNILQHEPSTKDLSQNVDKFVSPFQNRWNIEDEILYLAHIP